VESAIAFGKALGISKRWLVELFSFAPRPHACYRLKEKKDAPEWKVKRSAGYLEFCCKTLLSAPPAWDAKKIRSRFIDYLDALEKRGSCRTLTEKTLGNS
jgi:putative heme degradation protein